MPKKKSATRAAVAKSSALAAGLAVVALAASTSPASAANGFHQLALRSSTNVQSVYVTGVGISNWRAGGNRGTIRGPITVCYTYINRNNGDWATLDTGLRAHTNEAPGSQGTGPNNQISAVNWSDNVSMNVIAFTSRDCSNGEVTRRTLTMPNSPLTNFWLDLR
ncbi:MULTISPECIES: hypothetical protein [unclassified Streptomyces]|uniref:hypothetical protein n=1 Tax=unclassified Streptomyces TaxID=2593676 RepID=UPI00380868D4